MVIKEKVIWLVDILTKFQYLPEEFKKIRIEDMADGWPPSSSSTELVPWQGTSFPLLYKINEGVQITEVEKSISLAPQEISLLLLSNVDEEFQIMEVEKSMSLRSKKVVQSSFEGPSPHPSIDFSQISQPSILISTSSPSLSSSGTVSIPLKLPPYTYYPFQFFFKVSNLKVDKVKLSKGFWSRLVLHWSQLTIEDNMDVLFMLQNLDLL